MEVSVSVVNVSTAEGYRFSANCNISTKAFFEDVTWKLMSSMAGTGKSVRVASATVGSTPINVCDGSRALSYYLLEGEPLYILTEVYDSTYTDVCVSERSYDRDEAELITHSYCVPCRLNRDTVGHLKLKLSKMTSRQPNSLHIFLQGTELSDEPVLSDCGVDRETELQCMSICTRRRQFYGTPYINITPVENELYKLQQIVDKFGATDSACPAWRRALPGMWLEGVCTNQICPAYSCMVVMNQGFTNLDFVKDRTHCKCPICYQVTVPLICGFSKCRWRTVGVMKDVSGSLSTEELIVKEDWRKVSENKQYMTIFPDCSLWSSFKVIAEKLKENKFCVMCMNDITGEALTGKCGHSYHRSCLENTNSGCLQCFGGEMKRDNHSIYSHNYSVC